MHKQALIIWGGWEGHQPEQMAGLFRDMLVNVLSTPYFYYTYTGNLTHTRQRQFSQPNDATVSNTY